MTKNLIFGWPRNDMLDNLEHPRAVKTVFCILQDYVKAFIKFIFKTTHLNFKSQRAVTMSDKNRFNPAQYWVRNDLQLKLYVSQP